MFCENAYQKLQSIEIEKILEEICNSINLQYNKQQTLPTEIHHFKFTVKGLKLLLVLFINLTFYQIMLQIFLNINLELQSTTCIILIWAFLFSF